MGIPAPFIHLVKLLLSDAEAAISLNGLSTATFPITRGVRQGCPLAPYLFLLVAEALATVTKRAVDSGSIKGIMLPDGATQQVLSQFADDTTFSLKGAERYLATTSAMLTEFGLATGLVLNRHKSSMYWYHTMPPPPWLQSFGFTVTPAQELSRLLGTPFGVDLETRDVDRFLANKLTTKLRYWTSVHLSLAGRVIIVNSILLSSLWYFLNIW